MREASDTEKLYYIARMQVGSDIVETIAVFKWARGAWEPETGYQFDRARALIDKRTDLQRDGILLWRK